MTPYTLDHFVNDCQRAMLGYPLSRDFATTVEQARADIKPLADATQAAHDEWVRHEIEWQREAQHAE